MSSTATQQITIQGVVFTLPCPYVEGAPLKANEAAALNGVFGENIRNNTANIVKEAKAKKVGKEAKDLSNAEIIAIELDAAEQALLQQQIDVYADKYEFGVRVGGKPKDPLEREIQNIAVELLESTMRSKGITPSKVKKENPDAYNGALNGLIEARRDVLTKEAKNRIKNQQKLADDALGIDFGALTAKAPAAATEPTDAELEAQANGEGEEGGVEEPTDPLETNE